MTAPLRRLAGVAAIVGVGALALGIGFGVAGARVNTSKSIALGLYWTTAEPVEKGAYVNFCPPKADVFDAAKARGYIGAGFCPGGYGHMMKRVLAAKGDSVSFAADGVRVNGALLPRSAPLPTDAAGRPLPVYRADPRPLGDAEVLLMSDVSDTSFDGRYFGPIARSQIEAAILPVLTW